MRAHPPEIRSTSRTLAGLGAICAAALGAGCGMPERPEGRPPAIVLENVTMRHYAPDGSVRVGRADEVTYRRDSGQLAARAIAVDLPATEEMARGGTRVEAGAGHADVKGRKAEVEGGVLVRTGMGDEGTTEAARWDAATGVIEGDSPARLRGTGYDADAEAFRFHVEEQRLELSGGVRARASAEAAE